jgi:glucosamine--fructose-6-phosphate aminotransferase (isomerizing)
MNAAEVEEIFRNASGLVVVACGTAFYACLYGQQILERHARISTRAELAHEYRYRDPVLQKSAVGIVVSQSGETADSLAAAKLMRKNGMKVFCITNVPSSSLARECDGAFFMNAGIEVGVASTKAFSTMLAVFSVLTLGIARARGVLTAEKEEAWIRNLERVPEAMRSVLKRQDEFKEIAERYKAMKGYLYIGRGPYFGIALEGALKLKELAYVHAEGFAGGELKHGPIALVEPEMCVVALTPVTRGELHGKSLANIEEVRARKGRILALGAESDLELKRLSSDFIGLPVLEVEDLMPLLTVVPLQLIAYFISVARGCEVDQPRNLAKSVTVE